MGPINKLYFLYENYNDTLSENERLHYTFQSAYSTSFQKKIHPTPQLREIGC